MTFKPALTFLTISLSAHAVLAGAAWAPSLMDGASKEGMVTISYVEDVQKTPRDRKELNDRLKKLALATKKQNNNSIAEAPTLVVDSDTLLQDPKKAKVFSKYFGNVKERIRKTIRRRYSHDLAGGGNVHLVFILKADGSLESVAVRGREGRADETARGFAVECVRNAAPFGPFPKELDLMKISFSVQVLFGES